jgi:hypothetical protein
LEAYAEQIARRVQPGSVIVELGSGYVFINKIHADVQM